MKKKISFILFIVVTIIILLSILNYKSIAGSNYGEDIAYFDNSSFGNSRVYCWHEGQYFSGGGTYKLQYKYVITEDTIAVHYPGGDIKTYNRGGDVYSYFQGIAYIGYQGIINERSATNEYADKYQRAMWFYLAEGAGSYSGIERQGYYELGGWTGYEEILTNAQEVSSGVGDYIYTGTIYTYGLDSHQTMAYVDINAANPKTPTIELKFKKTDMAGAGLSGANLKIWDTDNGKTKIDGLSQLNDYWGLTSGSDGNFGTISITPANNTGIVKIKIQEIEAPNHCINLTQEITLTIAYNKETGEVTSISADNYSEYLDFETSKGTGIVTIKNIRIPEYKIIKVDQNGNKLGGAEFEIEFDINGEVYQTTVTTRNNGEIEVLTAGMKRAITNAFEENDFKTIYIWVDITETKAPEGYINIFNPTSVQLKYDGSKLVNVNDYDYNDLVIGSYKIEKDQSYITIKNIRAPEYKIIKVDEKGNRLKGAKFTIKTYINEELYEYTTNEVTTDSNGEVQILTDKMKNDIVKAFAKNKGEKVAVDITITETDAPTGYINSLNSVSISLTFDGDKIVNNNEIDFKDTVNNSYKVEKNKSYITIKNIRAPEYKIIKVDEKGKRLQGAKFTIKTYINGELYKYTTNEVTTDSNGEVQILTDKMKSDIVQAFAKNKGKNVAVDITITETDAPTGYLNSLNSVSISLTFDGDKIVNNNEIDFKDTVNNSYKVEKNKSYITIKNDKIPPANIKILKRDEAGNNLKNVKFSGCILMATGINEKTSGTISGGTFERCYNDSAILLRNITTNNNGTIEINGIQSLEETMYIVLKETDVSSSVSTKLKEEYFIAKIIWDDDSSTWQMQEISAKLEQIVISIAYLDITGESIEAVMLKGTDYEIANNSSINLTIKNESVLDKLVLTKRDSNTRKLMSNVKFNIKLTNVKSCIIEGKAIEATNNTITTEITTNSDGQIILDEIKLAANKKDIIININEIGCVGYKTYQGDIEITLTKTSDGFIVKDKKKDSSITDVEFNVNNDVELKTNRNEQELTLSLKNIPVMNLGGIVWEDTQTGIKEVNGPDGKYNNDENGMAGISIQLYKANGEQVTKDIYGNNLMTKTAKQGDTLKYKMYNKTTNAITLNAGEYIFPNLEKGTDYYVVFTYDGVNYKTVKLSENCYENSKESKVNEIGRNEFNAKFTTISDSATADTTAGTYATASSLGQDLTYKTTTSETSNGVKTSKLVTTDKNGNVLQSYQMTAKSNNYLNPDKNGEDWKGTWTSDGKINRNSYALHINCGLTYRFFDLAVGMDVEKAELTINGKTTTYNYNQILDKELSDIKLDELLADNVSNKKADNAGIVYNLYLYYSDYYYRISDYLMNGAIENKNTVQDGENDNQVIKDSATQQQELKAFVTYKVVIKNQSTVNSAKVNKLAYYYDANYNIVSVKDSNGNNIAFNTNGTKTINGTTKNYAEVSGFAQNLSKENDYRQELYFTFEVKKSEDGTRSLPKDIECANIVEILEYSTSEGLVDNDSCPGNVTAIGYEDDTDEAQGINIKVIDKARKVSGTVFEDTDKDGTIKNSEETNAGVNDVIVQLIEVKKINNKYYEYIWQETRSGSNKVKKISEDGSKVEEFTYDDSVTIKDGEYIFTDFIPGNYIIRYIYGDGSTYDITDNVKKYNGQDYQSTKNPNYRASWYNTARYLSDSSVARDNEARRLEVMSYSTMIDNVKGNALEMKTDEMLQNTWMTAETSRINVPVDADNIATEDDNTTVSFKGITNSIILDNMNFGLAKRPETKLVLEKHITGLKITPNGVGVQPIVEAKANINDILNRAYIELQGITTGLTAIKSDRDNRGFWKVETDVEELTQGATLEVEYTYVIKNESEEDYLNSTLVNQYETNLEGYADYLANLKKSVKAIMRTGQYAYSDSNAIGGYLGEFYYTGAKGTSDALVSSRAETLKESLNEQLSEQENVGDYFTARKATDEDLKAYIDVDESGNVVLAEKEILTVLEGDVPTKFLVRKSGENYTENDTDWTKTARTTTVLSSVTNGEIGGNYPSYIAEITKYSNAAGRRNMEAEPGNLSYVHSEDTTVTMNSGYNEDDEFWGETIVISKPTGEDKSAVVQIAIITTISVAILGVGIVLIKKYVLKK